MRARVGLSGSARVSFSGVAIFSGKVKKEFAPQGACDRSYPCGARAAARNSTQSIDMKIKLQNTLTGNFYAGGAWNADEAGAEVITSPADLAFIRLAWEMASVREVEVGDRKLAARALDTWNANPARRGDALFALFSKSGQYHGSFPDESHAHRYVDEVASTPAWIGSGYRVVRFR